MNKTKVIAFYLPQFHPIPENDKWWGKGFTEWTNVGKAKSYFPGHYQPIVPSDLGYYDLRVPEVREQQAELAKEAGVDAFCYWHYWFGNGKQLLEKPLQEVIKSNKPDFPFCLGWANHSWSKKNWNKDVSRFNNDVLIEQTYPGKEDIDNHFYKMLDAFKDSRYYKIQNKLCFYLYAPLLIPDIEYFITRWQELAKKEGLPGFYFIGGCYNVKEMNDSSFTKCDGVALDLKTKAFRIKYPKLRRRLSYLLPFPINVIRYSKAIKIMSDTIYSKEKVYPVVYPNWDHSPRVGKGGTIFYASSPKLFKSYIEKIISIIKDKDSEDNVIFIKSWNEWAEGNYMEPDLKYGKGYIHALREALDENEKL